jgi:hypothetical protein
MGFQVPALFLMHRVGHDRTHALQARVLSVQRPQAGRLGGRRWRLGAGGEGGGEGKGRGGRGR